ncbi:MAG TPA: alpha/beta hydrolase-fold protein, partial [Chthonomonadales bacterium]|nr:alpha/beta hydrolase-fold protein [Chthonomonadales bacterium]
MIVPILLSSTGVRVTEYLAAASSGRPAIVRQEASPSAASAGALHRLSYYSKQLNETRRLVVYTPPGYSQSGQVKFPVLYLLHGVRGSETTWISAGRVNRILDRLISQQRAAPMIVVLPNGDLSPEQARRRLFNVDLEQQIIPLVESSYRVIPDADHRAIAGFSMGAIQALIAVIRKPGMFGYLGCFSMSGRPAALDVLFADLPGDPAQLNGTLRLYAVSCGRQDGFLPFNTAYDQWLTSHGVRHTLTLLPGGHS